MLLVVDLNPKSNKDEAVPCSPQAPATFHHHLSRWGACNLDPVKPSPVSETAKPEAQVKLDSADSQTHSFKQG